MKTLYTFLSLISCLFLLAQQKGFVASGDVFGHRVFIKNNGQFNKEIPNGNEIKYAYTNGKEKVYFTSNSLVYHLQKNSTLTHEQFEEIEHGRIPKNIKPSKNYYVNMTWEGANSNIEIEENDKQTWYHSYGDKELKSDCFKRITYKNVYDNIDIEYIIPNDKEVGIKYNVIVHPNGDYHKVKINYSGDVEKIKLTKEGVIIKTPVEDITEHLPVSFQNNNTINTEFVLLDNTITFNLLNDYNHNESIKIDPWVTTLSSLTTNNYGYQVDYDNLGNYYVYGGGAPGVVFCIAKYNSSGTLQWTFNGVVPSQTWDTNGATYSTPGNFIVEKATGRLFMGNMSGFDWRVVRIASNGLYDNFISVPASGFWEIWDFDFNCNTGDLITFGCDLAYGSGGPLSTTTGSQTINNINGDFVNSTADIISVTRDPFGNTFGLYAGLAPNPNKISRINSTYNGSLWHVPTTYSSIVELNNVKYPGNVVTAGSGQPYNGMAVSLDYLFYYDGFNLAAYNKNTGAKLSSITITGYNVMEQGGIAVDNCNNVYLGGVGNILCYNFNGSSFTTLASITIGASSTYKNACDLKYNEINKTLYISGTGFGGMYSAIHSINCNPPSYNLAVSSSGACSGSGGATANVSTSISSPLISYSWYNSSGTLVSQTNNTTVLSNTVSLASGTYTVITQVNAPCGPINSQTINISTGTPPSPTASSGGVVTCSSPNVTLTGGGGGSYSWSGPSIVSGASTANPVVNAGGTYNLTVTGSNGCSASTSVFVSQNTTPPSPSASAGGAITCSSPNVTLTGGGGGSYSWSGPSIVSGAGTANPVVNAGGTYNLTVTGSNGCTAGTSVVVSQNTTPPSPSASAGGVITCANPNVTLTGGGGGSYSWSGPSIVSGAGTANPVVNAGGTYNLTVTGSNGCTAGTSVNVTASAALPTASAGSPQTLNCNTTSTSLNGSASGGNGVYNYAWSPATGLSATNIANPTANPSSSQTYVLLVTDGNGCQSSSNVVITVNTTPPSPSASAGSNLTCANTSLVLTGGGGGSYSWSGPGIVSGASTANPTINQPGTYNLTVTDGSNGCSAGTSVVVSQNVTVPSFVLGTASTLTTTCANPNANLTASSNADPNTAYTWLTPLNTTLNGNPVSASAVGVYTVYVTNTVNGCNSAATTNTVEIVADANIPTVTLSNSNAILTCANTTTNVTANPSVSSVSYNWSPTTGIVSGANTNNPTFNMAGTYSLVVTNTVNSCANGMSDYVVTITTNTTAPVIALSAGSNTGTITCSNPAVAVTPTINPSSGLTYTWSPASGLASAVNQANATFTANGVYQLMVTDVVTGCVSVLDPNSSFTIVSNIDTPTITVVPTSSNTIVGCGSNATVMYSVTVNSVSGNNSYNWQPSGSNSVFTTVSSAGVHSVTVTDNLNGCSTATVFNVVSNITTPGINAADSTLFPCDSNATSLIATSSNPNVSYAWQGASILSGANTNTAVIGSVGVYTVIVTDNVTNCFSSHTVAVTMDSVVALFSANPNTGVEPLVVTFFNGSVSSNTASTTYSWDFGNAAPTSTLTNPSNTFELSGVYSVTLVATLGVCSDSAYATIIVNEDVTLIIPNFFTPNGDGQNELFFITGIDKYPNNQLEIYNRWGSLIYLKKGYNNTFEGKSNQPSMGNGMLPTATYFYVLDLGDTNTKPLKGYIEIKY